jgi:glycosyltransferase involved in cell wall biosynthesis
MRVCFLTHYFPPEVGAPQTRIELLARTLAADGAEVTVHTGFPHYPDGGVKSPYRNRAWLSERRDGVAIVRSAVYPAANRGFAPRLLDHTAFALSALATARLTGPLDVVVAETPPLFTAAAGAVYARVKNAAYVVNVADRWPASAVELGALRDRRAIATAETVERWVYRRADLILSPTEGIATTLAQLPDAAGKSRRVWPVVDLDRFDLGPPGSRDDGAPLRVLFAGTVGLAHGLDVLVEASRLAGPEVVRTTIAGGGADAARIRELIRDRDVSNVEMLGVVGADRVPALYRESDASAVLLRDLPIFAGALPTKMLEGMAAGRPLLLAARGEAARFVEAAEAGLVVPPGDASELAAAVQRLHREPEVRRALGAAGRAYAEAHFGRRRAAEEWRTQLEEAVTSSSARRPGGRGRSARAAAGRYRAD